VPTDLNAGKIVLSLLALDALTLEASASGLAGVCVRAVRATHPVADEYWLHAGARMREFTYSAIWPAVRRGLMAAGWKAASDFSDGRSRH